MDGITEIVLKTTCTTYLSRNLHVTTISKMSETLHVFNHELHAIGLLVSCTWALLTSHFNKRENECCGYQDMRESDKRESE